MTMDALVAMLSCVEADGRIKSHAIVEDDQAKQTQHPPKGSAPLLKKITIEAIGKNELLLLPDKGRTSSGRNMAATMSPLLSTCSGTDQNRICDGVLIRILDRNGNDVTFIEIGYFDLKSGRADGYEGQFLSTRCFLRDYVLSLLKTFYGKRCEVIKERFVIFHTDKDNRTPSLQKKRSRPATQSANAPNCADKCIVKNEQKIPARRILN